MTRATFLVLACVSISAALPAVTELEVAREELASSTCHHGHTVCIDLYNGCGHRTGGCYDTCNPTTYSIPSCSPTPVYLVTTTANKVSTSTALAAVFAERIIHIEATPAAQDISDETSTTSTNVDAAIEESFTTTESVTPDFPVETGSAQSERPILEAAADASSTAIIPSPTPTSPSQAAQITDPPPRPVLKALAEVQPPNNNNNDAPITSKAQIACGKKTSCWDAKTSMNEACPNVRYGGCYDVCKGDPKTMFTPTCKGRKAGKWFFFS